jgi:UDP-N-acetylmuramoylalanine--D-glutamate ligase
MKYVVVLGGGESGVGTALLAKKYGLDVWLSDNGRVAQKYRKVLLHNDISFEEDGHSVAEIEKADVVMKSPGIPESIPLIKNLIAKGIPVISEIEFASRFTSANIIGITGSNGKTTTTMLTHHILKKAGLNVGIGGNIGTSFAGLLAAKEHENYVLELSSFQLDGIVDFAPHIAVITNITPDHLDRYDNNFDNYVKSKFRIIMNQKSTDYLIYDGDDLNIVNWLKNNKINSVLLPFSLEKTYKKGAFIKDDEIHINIHNTQITMGIGNITLKGKHNTKNAMAAAMTASLLKVRKETIRISMEDFEGVEHRLESVLTINGVEYINDSKATNVNAAYYALDSMTTPIVWIVGGIDKGNDYLELMPLVREKVKAIVCLGLDNQKIVQTFYNVVDLVVETCGAEEAAKVAYKIAEKGDTVLLSPACASFDLFENYEDRGNQFKKAVSEL